MGDVDSKKINKFLKNKKYNGEIIGSFTCSFRWPLRYGRTDDYNFVNSPKFNTCGSEWTLKVYPVGINETGDYMSVYLVNESTDREVFATYSIVLLDSDGADGYIWKDPERMLKFGKAETGDNEWGCEEFIELAGLYEEGCAYTSSGKLTIRVDIEVFGRDDLNKETLSSAVQNANETRELMKIADEEIYEVVKKLPALRNSVAQKRQEDGIVVARAPPPQIVKKHDIYS